MANIQDYIDWRGDLTLEKSPFNRIDALILCQITYLNFDGILKQNDFKSQIKLENLGEIFKKSPDFKKRSDMGVLINSQTAPFFLSLCKTERFKDFLITGYQSKTDLEKEEQFAAASYLLPDGTNFICYRGTDDTIVGWKEDFNLALFDVPAQKDAQGYMEQAAASLKGEIRVGGHSKGGNLAIYASFTASDKIKKRIMKIYNNDGPGFSEERVKSREYKSVVEKINSYYPQYSVVGMLFNNEGKYTVVESDEIGVMQHDPFSWHMKGTSFVNVEKIASSSTFFHDTFNSWVSQLEEDKVEKFINTLFDIIEATDARTNSEIEANLVKNSVKIIKALNSLDEEQRAMMVQVIKELFSAGHSRLPSLDQMIKNCLEDTKKERDMAMRKVKRALKLHEAKEKLIETKEKITSKVKKV